MAKQSIDARRVFDAINAIDEVIVSHGFGSMNDRMNLTAYMLATIAIEGAKRSTGNHTGETLIEMIADAARDEIMPAMKDMISNGNLMTQVEESH